MLGMIKRVYGEMAPGGATREQVVAEVKSVVRPVLKYRIYFERARYGSTPIPNAKAGNDYLTTLQGPAAMGRFGAAELAGVQNYLAHRDKDGYCAKWGHHRTMLTRNAGVYPVDQKILSRFSQVFLESLRELDVLGVWYRPGEARIRQEFAPQAKLLDVSAYESYYHERPWTKRLEGKRVLVISPFAKTIEAQYRRRKEVWRAKPEVMPELASLRTIRAPLSAALAPPEHPDWFAAMEYMKRQMEAEPFDFAIVGCGAWSMLLAVHAKRLGAWGIHMGGPTQILFGVRGRRWDENQGIARYYNDAWVRPSASETPTTVRQIENGCYW